MSIKNAHTFMASVRSDPALSKRIQGFKGRTAIQQLVALASEMGYAFTEEEYRAAVVACSAGELSEESVEELAREMGYRPQE